MNELLNKLKSNSFINSEVGMLTIAVTILVLILYIFILVMKFKKKSKFRKKYKQIVASYMELKELPINQLLNKIEKIGVSNVTYAKLYEEKKKTFVDLTLNEIDSFQNEIDHVYSCLRSLRGKKLDSAINNCNVKLQALSENVHNFYNSLKEITKEDDEARNHAFKTKESLRECRALYNEHLDELCYNESVFISIFDDIDSSFLKFEEYLDKGQFDLANDLINQLDETIIRLKEDLTQMPRIAAFTTQVLPKRLNAVIDTYNMMRSDGFPLHSLKITNTINDIKNELGVIKERLNYLEYEGINEIAAQLSESIDVVSDKLQKEKAARAEFDKNCNQIYFEVEDLERRFLKIKRGSVDILKVYLPTENFVQVLEELQQNITRLSMHKRDLDTYIHSSTPQPYSVLLEKMKVLEQQRKVVATLIDDYNQSFEDMKNEVESLYTKCVNSILKIKETESMIIDCQVDAFINKYIDRIDEIRQTLYQISQTISTQPIDVLAIRHQFSMIEPQVEEFINEIDEQVTHCRYAEKAILLANKYYGDFAEVKQVVDQAEVHFANAEFTYAMDITIELIQRKHPGVYNQELKNL